MKLNHENMAEIISRAKLNDPTLTEIEFDRNGYASGEWETWGDAKQLDPLFEALKGNIHVRKLTLEEAKISGAEAGRLFEDLLQENVGIQSLAVKSCNLGAEGAAKLAHGLRKNTTLCFLDLHYNHLGDKGMEHICDALKENTSLLDLKLNSNAIGNEGAQAFIQALKKNKTLQSIALNHNDIKDEGVTAILKMLKTNTSLYEADLDHLGSYGYKNLDDAGYKLVCDVIAKNQTLLHLNLRGIGISMQQQPFQQLATALNKNTSLINLDLRTTAIFLDSLHAFARVFSNKTIAEIDMSDHLRVDIQYGNHDKMVQMRDAGYALGRAIKDSPNLILLGSITDPDEAAEVCVFDGCINTSACHCPSVNQYGHRIIKNCSSVVNMTYSEDSFYRTLQKNDAAATQLIDKIRDEESPLTKEDVAQINERMPAIIMRAFYNGEYRKEAVVDLLETARKKAAAVNSPLNIPLYYKPYPSLQPMGIEATAGIEKVDLSALTTRENATAASFNRSATAKSERALMYQAIQANQLDELMGTLQQQGRTLSKEDCLYKPSAKAPPLIQLIAAQGQLARVMTLENWKNDPIGLSEVAQNVSAAQLTMQLREGLSVQQLHGAISAAQIKSKRRTISIGQ